MTKMNETLQEDTKTSKRPRIYKQWEKTDYEEIKDFGPSKTDDSQRDATDINNILKRYQKTGLLSHAITTQPQFGDFSESIDYQAAMHTVSKANQQFELLPAHQRERFNNNPQKMLEFLANENNREEAIKLGMIPPPPKEPIKAPIDLKDQTPNQP